MNVKNQNIDDREKGIYLDIQASYGYFGFSVFEYHGVDIKTLRVELIFK